MKITFWLRSTENCVIQNTKIALFEEKKMSLFEIQNSVTVTVFKNSVTIMM